ncbi:MAG: transglutaminase-like domain-containing protein [Bacillota bacterium]|nr:transglutaminase-like domain-containing protein [Bacillota bacterium]
MNDKYLLYIGALKVLDDFSESAYPDFHISHNMKNANLQILKQKYNLDKITDISDDFSKTTLLMRWVHDNVLHNGGSKDVEFIPKNSLSILDYSFRKGIEFGVYCRLQAIVFTECCLSIGLLARTIHCLPFSPNDFDSHVVSMVYISSLSKWILFDPGNNAYFTNDAGMALSPLEIRHDLAVDNVYINPDLQPHYNCDFSDKENSYKEYMAKNLFYIKCSAVNTFGTDQVKEQKTLHVAPKGFDIKTREISYCEYAIKNSPPQLKDDWLKHYDEFKNQEIIKISQEQFLCKRINRHTYSFKL